MPNQADLEGLAVMELFIAFFLLALVLASAFGWVADSRDGADWSASSDGLRQPRRGS
jgi:hypothetical protein